MIYIQEIAQMCIMNKRGVCVPVDMCHVIVYSFLIFFNISQINVGW